MERQIKFRGKTLTNGRWVFGDPSILIWRGEKTKAIWNEKEWVLVNSETFGQFTGILDKNGKEIYEGDIVRYIDCNDTISINEVRYADAGFTPVCEIAWMADIEGTECEVIGNRFDNPELISKKQ